MHATTLRRLGSTLVTAAVAAAVTAGTLTSPPTPAPSSARATTTPPAPPAAAAEVVLDEDTIERVAYTLSSADKRIASKLNQRVTTARFGSGFSGAVIDISSNKVIWSRNGNTGRMPASTTKYVTAINTLNTFGPNHRFTTTVRQGTRSNQVILVGSGDPGLSSGQVSALAKTTAAKLKAKKVRSVRVYFDDSLFAAPALATGWRRDYVPADTPWLRALVVDGRQSADTSRDAGQLFAARLRANGITVTHVGRGKAPAKTPTLAASPGKTVYSLVSTMMMNSDNEHAEALHRLVGVKKGKGNTWSAARSAQAAGLSQAGLKATALYDGSGLSRADRLTALQLTQLVREPFEPANKTKLAALRNAHVLPTAGRTGTLRGSWGRFTAPTSRCAAGKVWAKTGTLNDAAALAGWTRGKDGRLKAFAFVVNGRAPSATLRQNIDMAAATVNGCY